MNFKEKRRAKKIGKIFIILAYAMLITFVVILIVGFIKMSGALIFLIGIISMIVCFIFAGIGQYFLNKRIYYKEAIAEYGQCTFFTKCIQLLMTGDENSIDLAIDNYHLINEDTSRRRFIYAFIIASSYYSKDKKKAEKGRKHLDDILNTYNPEKVSFKK